MQTWEKSQTSNLWKRQPSGVFYIRCKIRGKQFSESLKTKDLTYARRILPTIHKRLQEAATQDGKTEGLVTFKDAEEALRARVMANRRLKPKSKEYRLETFDQINRVAPWIGKMRLRAISERDCQRVSDALAERYSSTRYNNALDSLKQILGLAVEKRALNVNPATPLGRAKVVTKEKHLPSKEQLKEILDHIRNSRGGRARYNWELVSFLAFSGCRIGEANRVTLGNINREAGIITVLGDPETGTKNSTIRRIPIIPSMAELLDSMDREGEPSSAPLLKVKTARVALANACEKAGVQKLTHHKLRDVFATTCLESDVDVKTVAEWLGHKDGGALLLKTYAHLRSQHFLESAAKVDF